MRNGRASAHDEPAAQANRLLVVAPNWLGDAVMATSAAALLRRRRPGWWLGGLVKPAVAQLYEGLDLFDELHVEPRAGMMGPKRAAATVRPRRYRQALLLTNSFSTALVARLAGIPRRVGFNRDGRGLLLTDPVAPTRLRDLPEFAEAIAKGSASPERFAPVSAHRAYLQLACALLEEPLPEDPPPLQLALSGAQRRETDQLLARAGLADGPFVALCPGASKALKRWPAERFGAVAAALCSKRGWAAAFVGSPQERDVVAQARDAAIAQGLAPQRAVDLAQLGLTVGSLKGVLGCAALLVANDTGPRHIAAAMNTPAVVVFGPTDPRWTTIPAPLEARVLADPDLPRHLVADDHPRRCAVERVAVDRVLTAAEELLTRAGAPSGASGARP